MAHKVTLNINVWKPSGKWYAGVIAEVDSDAPSIIENAKAFWDWVFDVQAQNNPTITQFSGGGVISFEGFTVTVATVKQEEADHCFFNYLKHF